MASARRRAIVVAACNDDLVETGFIKSMQRPGGNITGFMQFEYNLSGKWLGLLKEIAPNVKRVAVLRESFVASGPGQFGAIQAASPGCSS